MAIDRHMPILVVDDYKTMLRIVRSLLKQIGFENVEDATDGAVALSRMRERDFGLVISDWNMEPMSGLQLLKEVRADKRLNTLPFVMITAESRTDHVIEAKKAGVSSFIVKPFNAETLRSKLSAVFDCAL